MKESSIHMTIMKLWNGKKFICWIVCKYALQDKIKSEKSNWSTSVMEKVVSKELEAGIDGIAKIIPNIRRKLIAPVINVVHNEQLLKCDINMENVPSYQVGLW